MSTKQEGLEGYKIKKDKKHSENADTYTSWDVIKVKKAYVIMCFLMYCILVRGMMSVDEIFYEIWPFVFFEL